MSITAAALAKLLACEGDLPASALTPSQRRELDELARHTGALHRVPAGRGTAYRVRSREQLQQHLTTLRPMDADALSPSLPSRAANIGSARDSKARGHRHSQAYLLAKAVGEGVVWRRGDDEFDLSSATRISGAGALALTAADTWHSNEPLWLVENQALFDRLDWFPESVPATVAYYAGHLPGELLQWLSHTTRALRIVLFADYDGVGLLNFARLHRATGGQCEFWLMPDWQAKLHRYGNRALWEATRADAERAAALLRQSTGNASPIDELAQAMAREGAALEHEAVWLPAK